MRRQPAFTLVELLVVVAIIALLISIAMPSLSAARRISKSTKCKHNLHQIGIAMEAYFSRSGDLYPCIAPLPSAEPQLAEDEDREPYPAMPVALKRETRNSSELFECPADVVKKDDPGYHALGILPGRRYFDTEATSYEWNMLLNPDYDADSNRFGPLKRRWPKGATLFKGLFRASHARTEMARDFDLYHGRDNMKGSINCLYGDLHVASYRH